MKIVHKIAIVILSLILVSAMPLSVFAENNTELVGINISDKSINLFLHGPLDKNITGKVSGWDCKTLYSSSLADAKIITRTLFLIDTSTSISETSQAEIKTLLMNLIEDKPADDQYAIVGFGNQYKPLIDFTSERFDLSKVAQQLVFEDTESNIYQAMEQALSSIEKADKNSEIFSQIVVLSDGVERSEAGIIKEELLLKIRDGICPIQTIGLAYRNNGDNLKELHALSRVSGGSSHTINSDTNIEDVASALLKYMDTVFYVELLIPQESKDGAVRKLEVFNSANELIIQRDVHMPREEQQASNKSALLDMLKENEELKPEAVVAEKTPNGFLLFIKENLKIILIVVGAILLLAVLVVTLLWIKKKRAQKPQANVP